MLTLVVEKLTDHCRDIIRNTELYYVYNKKKVLIARGYSDANRISFASKRVMRDITLVAKASALIAEAKKKFKRITPTFAPYPCLYCLNCGHTTAKDIVYPLKSFYPDKFVCSVELEDPDKTTLGNMICSYKSILPEFVDFVE